MNPRQRTILKVCVAVILLVTLFPPFATSLPNGGQSGNGFSFILWPPTGSWSLQPTVNAAQLFVQLAAICLIGGIGYVLAGQAQGESESSIQLLRKLATRWGMLLGIPMLRALRGLIGLLGGMVIVGLARDLLWLISPDSRQVTDSGGVFAIIVMKALILIFVFLIFKRLRVFINYLHAKKTGQTALLLAKMRSL